MDYDPAIMSKYVHHWTGLCLSLWILTLCEKLRAGSYYIEITHQEARTRRKCGRMYTKRQREISADPVDESPIVSSVACGNPTLHLHPDPYHPNLVGRYGETT